MNDEKWKSIHDKYLLEKEQQRRKIVLRIYEMTEKDGMTYIVDPFGKLTKADMASEFFYGELKHLQNFLRPKYVKDFCLEQDGKYMQSQEAIEKFVDWVKERALLSQLQKDEKEYQRASSVEE